MSSALFGFFLNSDCVRIKYSTTKDCDDAGNEKYHKKFLVIIISQNQCDKHHARDFHILTQSIIFPAELTDQTDLLEVILLLLRYMVLWSILHCALYCTRFALCFQRQTVIHKRLKLRGPYFLCKMPSILSIWLYFKGFF